MGTHYDIKIAHSPLTQVEARRLHQEVETYLRDMNRKMSTYLEDSEISRFNQSRSTEPFPVSPEFAYVTRSAIEWADRTGGAFDPTLDPLIHLWGFGYRTPEAPSPSEAELAAALARIGYGYIQVPDDVHIRKLRPDIELNLNAIAKGYAVDGVQQILLRAGAVNHYIEIGGDVAVSGGNREGDPWRIGIEYPDPDAAAGERLHGIAHLSSGALAGSGDYRQFRTDADGRVLSHILDPRNGHPVQHELASVNVWATSCMDADAIATALIVMGLEEGLRWVEAQPDAEAVFFTRRSNGRFEPAYSPGFKDRTRLTLLNRL